ncbi:hypothetical protein [Kitasatospora sp. NPDC087315]|uniref:hypothetical protein n=1 Tax=Kitasatospora sp. NPDC087315 TaxID=3364069 RepID=UPI0037FA75E7
MADGIRAEGGRAGGGPADVVVDIVPGAYEEAAGSRGRGWGCVLVGCGLPAPAGVTVVAGCLAIWAGLLSSPWRDDPDHVDDPRACAPSTVELGDALAHFGLTLPDGAANVRFQSGHGMAERDLTVGFDLPETEAKGYLVRSHLPAATRPGVSITGCVADEPSPDLTRVGSEPRDEQYWQIDVQVAPAGPGMSRVGVRISDL